METYHCGWCGWNGTRIAEQRTGDGRHVCYNCGNEVRPGPHSSEPGAGSASHRDGGGA